MVTSFLLFGNYKFFLTKFISRRSEAGFVMVSGPFASTKVESPLIEYSAYLWFAQATGAEVVDFPQRMT